MNQFINAQYLQNTQALHEQFVNAWPFKHVFMENFLEPAFLQSVRREFPKPPELLENEFGIVTAKHAVPNIRDIGPVFQAWDDLLKSEAFIAWVSAVTGIEGLIYDPEYHGAGTHNNMHGQSMDVHIDFNFHRTTGYHRRLNLIVYITEEWEEAWGGSIEFHNDPWEPEVDRWVSFPCFGNNAVFFETNEISWHGFSEIRLPEDKRHLSRKSLTVYYYSKERPAEEIGTRHQTIYVPNPLPASIQPGKVISEDEHYSLLKNFAKRNQYLQAMYDREAAQMQVIDNQKHLLNLYDEAFRIPIIGFVKQIGRVSGILPNLTVNANLILEMEAVKTIQSFTLEGFVPDFVNGGNNTLQIELDDQLAKMVSVNGHFNIQVAIQKKKGDIFQLKIIPTSLVSPLEMGLNDDPTTFGFVFIGLTFD
mgnify:CR=1 FL=1